MVAHRWLPRSLRSALVERRAETCPASPTSPAARWECRCPTRSQRWRPLSIHAQCGPARPTPLNTLTPTTGPSHRTSQKPPPRMTHQPTRLIDDPSWRHPIACITMQAASFYRESAVCGRVRRPHGCWTIRRRASHPRRHPRAHGPTVLSGRGRKPLSCARGQRHARGRWSCPGCPPKGVDT